MAEREDLATLRAMLSNLQGLLVLSMLMAESADEGRILHLATTALPSMGVSRLVGAFLLDGGWQGAAGPPIDRAAQRDIEAQLAVLSPAGGAVSVMRSAWAWAFPLRSVTGYFGFMVVASDSEPLSDEQFLVRVLAQQAGIALASARLHARDEATAADLRRVNTTLTDTVAALERNTAIHARLTQVAVARGGQQGIADALHELTGYSIAVEDRHGTVEAWSGPERPETSNDWTGSQSERERLLREVEAGGTPMRDGDCLIAVAQPRPELIGVICLYDPERTSGPSEEMALEHASTVLAVELGRLFGEVEAESRLGRDLIDELLSGASDDRTARLARALGVDLSARRRVVVIEDPGRHDDSPDLYDAVRRVSRTRGAGSLVVARRDAVVLLAEGPVDWPAFRIEISAGTGGRCRLGVGGTCLEPAEYARSYREATLALRLLEPTANGDGAAVFDDLGVYQLFVHMQDVAAVEQFCRLWIGKLVDYDASKHAALVPTLTRYLEHGGNYDAAARDLSIHRSTLKYRLQRIRAITDLELSDPEIAFNLGLATRAWKVLGAIEQQDSAST